MFSKFDPYLFRGRWDDWGSHLRSYLWAILISAALSFKISTNTLSWLLSTTTSCWVAVTFILDFYDLLFQIDTSISLRFFKALLRRCSWESRQVPITDSLIDHFQIVWYVRYHIVVVLLVKNNWLTKNQSINSQSILILNFIWQEFCLKVLELWRI